MISSKSTPMRLPINSRGFILIMILGLLGILAYLAVAFIQLAQTEGRLSLTYLQKAQARMLARSGLEYGAAQVAIESLVQEDRSLGVGSFRISMHDANSRIHLNDGIVSGKAALGSEYLANAIDPYPIGSEVVVAPVGFSWHTSAYEYVILNIDFSPIMGVEVGDYLVDESGWKSLITNFDGMFATVEDSGGPVTVTQVKRVSMLPDVPSAKYNLRIRHLLNAYGDAHRFLASIGEPAGDLSNFGQSFEFTSATSGIPGEPMPMGDGLGDKIISNRPAMGFKSWESLEGLVDAWGIKHLVSTEPPYAPEGFFSLCLADLTLIADVDKDLVRLDRAPIPFKERLNLSSSPLDFSDCWKPMAKTPVNFNGASLMVKAALLYAPVHLQLIKETDQPIKAYEDIIEISNGDRYRNVRNHEPCLQYAYPELDPALLTENGVTSGAQSGKLLSMRDALRLARVFEDGTLGLPPLDFDSFGRQLHEYRLTVTNPYERLASPNLVNPIPVPGGYFSNEVVERILPVILSPVRRVPYFLGAPQALLTPLPSTEGAVVNGATFWADDHVTRDAVPLIDFAPRGMYLMKSEGLISGPKGRMMANALLEVTVQLYETISFRSQRDFESISSPGTSSAILFGPERTQFTTGGNAPSNEVVEPDSVWGFVGLKDRHESWDSRAQIVMNFNKDSTDSNPQGYYADSDTSWGFQAPTGLRSPQNADIDPFLNIDAPGAAIDPQGWSTESFRNSSMEGPDVPFMGNGPAGSDLCPFGGVFFNPAAGLIHTVVDEESGGEWGNSKPKIEDALYWRLQDSTPEAILPVNGEATGIRAGRGCIHLWCRIPTTHLIPLQGSATKRYLSNYFHLNFWQKHDSRNQPVSISLSYRYNVESGFGQLVGRYETRSGWSASSTGHRQYYANWIGYPIYSYANDPAMTVQLGNLNLMTPWNTNYDQWIKSNQSVSLEKVISLAKTPESGPGTWHRVTLGWDVQRDQTASGWGWPSWDFTEPGKSYGERFWLRLHDASNVDHMESVIKDHVAKSMNHPTLPQVVSFPQKDEYWTNFANNNMTFSLGAVHCRNHPNVQPTYYVGWKLNSCLDNVQVMIGAVPDEYRGYNGEAFLPPNPDDGRRNRYDIWDRGDFDKNEPYWEIIPSGVSLIAAQARIFTPRDSKDDSPQGPNVPRLDIDLVDLNKEPIQDLIISGNSLLCPQSIRSSSSRLRLVYRGRNIKNQLLVNDDSDNWSEIPWIESVTFRSRTKDHPRILSFTLR